MHPLAAPNLSIFQCPSNPVSRGNFGKNSMVYNNGMHPRMQDGTWLLRNYNGNSRLINSMDKNSGVGTQQFNSTADPVTLDDLKDGNGFTLMFSENVQVAMASGRICEYGPPAAGLHQYQWQRE